MPEMLKAADVVAALNIRPATVYKLIGDGVIPSVKIGKSVRVPRAALEAWITEQTRPARSVAREMEVDHAHAA